MSLSSTWITASSAIPCPYCGLFASRLHQERCTKKPVRCMLCDAQLTAASISAHQQGECPQRRAACPGCSDVVLSRELECHLMAHCSARSFTCAACGEVFWIAAEYVRHALPRCGKAVVQCQLCGHPVPTATLAQHYQQCAAAALGRANSRPLSGSSRARNSTMQNNHVTPDRQSPLSHAALSPSCEVTVPSAGARSVSEQRPISAPSTRRSSSSPLRWSPAALPRAGEQSTPWVPAARNTSTSPSRARIDTIEASRRPHTAGAARSGSSALIAPHSLLSNDAASPSASTPKGVVAVTPFLMDETVIPLQSDGTLGGEKQQSHARSPSRSTSVERLNRASTLRQQKGGEQRAKAATSSLAVRDSRQAALSQVLHQRELIERLKAHISSTPQLPSFIAPPPTDIVMKKPVRGRR